MNAYQPESADDPTAALCTQADALCATLADLATELEARDLENVRADFKRSIEVSALLYRAAAPEPSHRDRE